MWSVPQIYSQCTLLHGCTCIAGICDRNLYAFRLDCATRPGECLLQAPACAEAPAPSYRKALLVLVFVGDVDEEGDHGGVALHELHHKVEAQMHALTDQALMPSCTVPDEALQGVNHHLTLCLVALHNQALPS